MLVRLKSRLALVAAAAGAVVSAHLVAAAPAEAAFSDCPQGWMCLFAGPFGTGGLYYTGAQPQNLGFMDNNAESLYNRTSDTYCYFAQSNHTGLMGRISPGESITLPPSQYNTISSLGFVGGVC